MSGPEVVRIKRKRSESAPDTLVLQYAQKKSRGHEGQVATENQRYERRRDADSTIAPPSSTNVTSKSTGLQRTPDAPDSHRNTRRNKRIFRLTKPTLGAGVGADTSIAGEKDHIATFQAEKKENVLMLPDWTERPSQWPETTPAVQSVTSTTPRGKETKEEAMLKLADELHSFAVEVAAKESKPHITSMPKLPGYRSRALHQQRSRHNKAGIPDRQVDVDMDTDQDNEYVYDTYVLTSTNDRACAPVDIDSEAGSVGYLVITKEDQALWEAFIEDEPSDKDWNSDEEDENAEDWYGADYPEDELASDDEFNRNTYGYRARGGSDDEAWDEDTGAWSDEEYDRQMNPWRMKSPHQSSKYLEPGDAEDDDSGMRGEREILAGRASA